MTEQEMREAIRVLEANHVEGGILLPLRDDICPRCGGSFEATGGKPMSGPYQCQKCAYEDYLQEE